MAVSVPNVATGRLATGSIGGAVGTLLAAGSGDAIVGVGTSSSGNSAALWANGVPMVPVVTESTGRRSAIASLRGPRAARNELVSITFFDGSAAVRAYVGGFRLADSQDSTPSGTAIDTDAVAGAGTTLSTAVDVPVNGGLVGVACTGATSTISSSSGATAAASITNAQLSSTFGYELIPAGGTGEVCSWTYGTTGNRSCVTAAFGPRAQSLAALDPAVDATGVSPSVGTLTATMVATAVLGSAGNVRVYETVAPSAAPTCLVRDDDQSTGTTSVNVRFPGQAPAWVAGTVYTALRRVENDGGRIYVCTSPGTSAGSGGPTGTGTGITDGSCVWDYVQDAIAPAADDWVFVCININGTAVIVPPDGWNALNHLVGVETSLLVLTRKCDGSESDTIALTLSTANDVTWRTWRWSGGHANDYPYILIDDNGGASWDPSSPSVAVPYSEPCAVMAYAAIDSASGDPVTGYPSGYGDTGYTESTNGTAGNRISQAFADTSGTGTSFAPGAFLLTSNRACIAVTIVLRPADPSVLVETIAYSACSVSGNDLTIPIGALSPSTAHHVTLDVVQDWYGFDSTQREWRFTTAAGSSDVEGAVSTIGGGFSTAAGSSVFMGAISSVGGGSSQAEGTPTTAGVAGSVGGGYSGVVGTPTITGAGASVGGGFTLGRDAYPDVEGAASTVGGGSTQATGSAVFVGAISSHGGGASAASGTPIAQGALGSIGGGVSGGTGTPTATGAVLSEGGGYTFGQDFAQAEYTPSPPERTRLATRGALRYRVATRSRARRVPAASAPRHKVSR